MGRIDDALRRANFDVGRGTGSRIAEPGAAPWTFEGRTGSAARAQARLAPSAPQAHTRPGRIDPSDGHWAGLDPTVMEGLVVASSATPLLVERFRSLATTLHQAQRERHVKSIMVTSASPGDGKSHVSANLALTLSDSFRASVLLIDADLRRPSLHRLFGVDNSRGLSNALKAVEDEPVPAVQLTDTLTLIPAGRPDPDPLGGLSSDRMRHLVHDAAARFDWVIVDAAPVGVLADGRLISEALDGVLLVVRAGVTRWPDLEAAADTVGRERILGIVLNAVDPADIRGKEYYGHYYGPDTRRSRIAG